MKYVKTVPFASFTLAAGLLLCTSVGCDEPDSEDAVGAGGTTPDGSGGTIVEGAGGSTTGGAEGTTGGATSAAGGAAAAGGGAGTGGADGTGGAAELTGDTLLGVDGKFWAFRATSPDDTGSSKYWLTDSAEACPAEGFSVVNEYIAKGDPTKEYTVNFEVRGALALRCIENGTPTGTVPDPNGMNEAFYVGGEPSAASTNNVVTLTVSPDVATAEANTYYLNGMPADSGMCDEQITYDVKYTGSFVIMGNSTVTLSLNSPDCQALPNCGPDAASCAPRSIDTEGIEVRASPSQPVSDVFFGDNEELTELYPQWLIFDIQDITTTP